MLFGASGAFITGDTSKSAGVSEPIQAYSVLNESAQSSNYPESYQLRKGKNKKAQNPAKRSLKSHRRYLQSQ